MVIFLLMYQIDENYMCVVPNDTRYYMSKEFIVDYPRFKFGSATVHMHRQPRKKKHVKKTKYA